MQSNQTRPAPAVAYVAGAIVVLAVAAWLASKVWAPAGVLVVVGAFGVCGLTRRRQQRTADLPRPAEAPLPTVPKQTPLAA